MPAPLDLEHYRSLVAAAAQAVPGHGAPCFGLLGVEREGRTKTYALGPRTQLGGDLDVLDWRRAPLAQVFFAHGEGEDFELEHDQRVIAGRVVERALLTVERGELMAIERGGAITDARTGTTTPLPAQRVPDRSPEARAARAIVLDPQQQRAVDTPAGRPLLVLGEAGFGKTTVAAHRVAQLARGYERAETLVIVPTRSLARLWRRTLDGMGVRGVAIETFERWILARARDVFPDVPGRDAQGVTPAIARLKRHPALRTVLADVSRRQKGAARRKDLLHLFGDRDLMERVVAASDGTIPRHAIDETLEHTRVQWSQSTEKAHAHVDPDHLITADGRAIDDGTPMEDVGTLDAEDCAVLFELHRLRTGHTPGTVYRHVVVDEAQELSPLELAVLARAVRKGGSLTVAGDAEQHTDASALFFGWARTMHELGADAHEAVTLLQSHRCPPEITAFARGIVGRGAPATRASGRLVATREPSACHLEAHVIDEIRRLEAADARLAIAVITRTATAARALHARLSRVLVARLALGGDVDLGPGVTVTCMDEVKGLEMDVAIVPDADADTYPDDAASRRALYVAATRALHATWLLAAGEWTPCAPLTPA